MQYDRILEINYICSDFQCKNRAIKQEYNDAGCLQAAQSKILLGNDLTMCVAAVGGVFVFYAWQKQLIWGMKMTKTVARAWSQAKLCSPELEFGEEHCCIITCVWIRIYDSCVANRIFSFAISISKIKTTIHQCVIPSINRRPYILFKFEYRLAYFLAKESISGKRNFGLENAFRKFQTRITTS